VVAGPLAFGDLFLNGGGIAGGRFFDLAGQVDKIGIVRVVAQAEFDQIFELFELFDSEVVRV